MNKKNHELRVRISETEYIRLKSIADKIGLSVSELVRISISGLKVSYKSTQDYFKD